MQKTGKFSVAASLTFAAALLSSLAPARATVNLGFESSDTTGWTASGDGLSGADISYGAFAPVEGSYLGYVQGGTQDVYTTLSQDFTLTAGQRITGSVGFRALDAYDSSIGLNDNGYLSINGVQIFYTDVATVGSFHDSGWQTFTFTAPSDGVYALQIGAENTYDNTVPSGVVLDNVKVLAIPEPEAWTLMLVGLGGVGAVLRRRVGISETRA